jgi:hypothetical protein
MFKLTPQLLEMGLARLGIFAGQFKNIDTESKRLLVRFVLNAADSGDINVYIKKRLGYLESHDEEFERPEPVKAQSREVGSRGELDDKGARRR